MTAKRAADITSQRRSFAENSYNGTTEINKRRSSDTYSTNSGISSARSGGYGKNIDIFVDDDIPYKKSEYNLYKDISVDETTDDVERDNAGKPAFADLSEKSRLDTAISKAANSFNKDDKDEDISEAGEPAFYNEAEPEPRLLGEAFSTYIIVEYGDNIVFVDKHASHERIIFERLKSSMSTSPPAAA